MIIHKSIKKNSHSLILLMTFVLLLVAGLLLLPKVSARFISLGNSRKLTNFIYQTKQTNLINAQSFWQLREFYSPGYFLVDKNGLSGNLPHAITANAPHPFSIFSAAKTKSYDFLVEKNTLSMYISNPYQNILIQTPSLLISVNNKNTLIAFILPATEMLSANGFFKISQDKNLLQGKYWLDVTLLQNN